MNKVILYITVITAVLFAGCANKQIIFPDEPEDSSGNPAGYTCNEVVVLDTTFKICTKDSITAANDTIKLFLNDTIISSYKKDTIYGGIHRIPIYPILEQNCLNRGCHQGNGTPPYDDADWTSYVKFRSYCLQTNNTVINHLRGINVGTLRMPLNGPYLPEKTIQRIEHWIAGGCKEN